MVSRDALNHFLGREGAPSVMPDKRWVIVGGAVLAAVHLALGFGFIESAAPTYDEPVHLAAGYSCLKTGIYRLNAMDHPPLAEMWAALPLLPLEPNLFLQHPDWLSRRVYHYADLFLYHNRVSAERMMNRARRFCLVTWGVLLAGVLGAWAWSEAGPVAALGALLAFAFCPALLSNLSLVTTDGAPAVLFFCAFALLSRRRGLRCAGLAGTIAGLAMAAKFNMAPLPLLAAALLFADWRLAQGGRGPVPWAEAAVFAAAALAVLAFVYRVSQFPIYWGGLAATAGRLEQGRSSFLHGGRSTTGSWLYFPAALLMKTPSAVLILAGLGLVSALRSSWRRSLWVWAPPAVFFAAALGSKVQIGLRHVLPVAPFLLLWAGLGAARLWERGRSGRASLAALAAWLAGSVLRAQPSQLAYFNELAGGPSGGYRWLTDSNLDWGQDLKGLAQALHGLGDPPVYLCYFGTADPADYGIRYLPIGIVSNVERAGDAVDPAASGRALLAVSATNLQGTYYADPRIFDWLAERSPLKVIGYSIFLYDLTGDAEGRRRLASLAPPSARRSLLLE